MSVLTSYLDRREGVAFVGYATLKEVRHAQGNGKRVYGEMHMSFYDNVEDQVRDISPAEYPETREELIHRYKEEYGNGWNRALARDLVPLIQSTGLKPPSEKSLMRRFQGARLTGNVSDTHKAEYEALGKTLKPTYTPPENGYVVTFEGEILISDKCVWRSFTTYVTGENAEHFAATGDPSDFFGNYFGDGEDISSGVCQEPYITIEPA